MTTQYTPILALALPVTGELSGTWGDVVNDNITSMVEQAIAGLATINTWAGNGHTLTTANGTTSESRCAMLVLTDTGVALTGAATVICPTASKIYIVKNTSGQSATITTAAGTGVSIPNGETMFVFCDGTNVVQAVTRIASADVDFAKLKGTGAVVVTNILDEDNMASDSATALATQQSIKAYVDSQIAANNDLSEVLANGNTTGGTDIVVSTGDSVQVTDLTASVAVFTDASKNLVSNAITGTGNVVMSTSPTLVTPALGTPSALVGTNITGTAAGLTAGNVTTNANLTGAVTSVGNATSLGSFTSAQLATALTDETGTGANVFATSPTLVTPALGTPSSGVVTNLTGTASININGTVGATTASTGAFTTLSASGATTLSGGTANGVTYLNGSKVLTSGSALTFDGTNLSSTGGATFQSGPTGYGGGEVRLGTTASGQQSAISTLSVDSPVLVFDHRGTSNTGVFVWRNGTGASNELARLTSTGLGIGTSSPVSKITANNPELTIATRSVITVSDSAQSGSNVTALTKAMAMRGAGGSEIAYVGYKHNEGYGAEGSLELSVSGGLRPMVFRTDNTERMRINSAGNVGIGTSSPSGKLSVSSSSYPTGTVESSSTNLAALSFTNSNAAATTWAVGVQGGAYQTAGKFSVNLSGVGDALTIDSSRNVGIGTTSPSAPLEVNGTSTAVRATSAQLWLSRTTASTHYQGICFRNGLVRDAFIGRPPNSDDITFGFDAGSVLAEAMRIDSSGNLLVGTTSSGATNTNSINFNLAPGYGFNSHVNHINGTSSGIPYFSFNYNGNLIGSIAQSGTTAVLYNTSSDYRLKEDWQPMTGATERVKALKPVNFAWKADGSRVDGFLAHEAQEVVPECVTGTKDAVDAEGKPNYQGIDQSKLVPLLTAALQEALTKIDSLTARIEALEGN